MVTNLITAIRGLGTLWFLTTLYIKTDLTQHLLLKVEPAFGYDLPCTQSDAFYKHFFVCFFYTLLNKDVYNSLGTFKVLQVQTLNWAVKANRR